MASAAVGVTGLEGDHVTWIEIRDKDLTLVEFAVARALRRVQGRNRITDPSSVAVFVISELVARYTEWRVRLVRNEPPSSHFRLLVACACGTVGLRWAGSTALEYTITFEQFCSDVVESYQGALART